MVREATLRSQRPMSQRPVMPRSARRLQLFVGDLVEAVDVAAVFFGELLEPDVGALGDEDDVGHPGLVGGEGFVFVEGGLVVGGVAAAALPSGR